MSVCLWYTPVITSYSIHYTKLYDKKVEILSNIQTLLNEEELYQRTFTQPSSTVITQLNLKPREETVSALSPWSESSLAALIRRVLSGTTSITLSDGSEDVEVSASYPEDLLNTPEKLESFLIPWQESLIPLRHFFDRNNFV